MYQNHNNVTQNETSAVWTTYDSLFNCYQLRLPWQPMQILPQLFQGKGTWITFWLEGSDMAPRTHGLNKDRHKSPQVTKQREKGWQKVKELLPKLAKQSKNGVLSPLKVSASPKKCVQLPPITSWGFIRDNQEGIIYNWCPVPIQSMCRRFVSQEIQYVYSNEFGIVTLPTSKS